MPLEFKYLENTRWVISGSMGSRRSVSAKGASYTSLGHRPRKTGRLFKQGLKARTIKVFSRFS